jgi:hypothetical protein
VQSARYDGVVEVRSDFGRQAYAGATVKRSRTVSEDISEAELRRVWYEMTEKMLHDLDRQLEDGIGQYLAKYLR